MGKTQPIWASELRRLGGREARANKGACDSDIHLVSGAPDELNPLATIGNAADAFPRTSNVKE